MLDIKQLLQESTLSDEKIGCLCDLPRCTIWRIRTGKVDPKLSTVNTILKALGKTCYAADLQNRIN